jgi:hypothetical protein
MRSINPASSQLLYRPSNQNGHVQVESRSIVLDSEVVAVDENGIPCFQLLQRFQKQPAAPTLYYVFDIIWRNGEDITGNPLMDPQAGSGTDNQAHARHSGRKLCRRRRYSI